MTFARRFLRPTRGGALFVFTVGAALLSCSAFKSDAPIVDAARSARWSSAARYLAGLGEAIDPSDASQYARHRSRLADYWSRVEGGNVAAMKAWRERELAGAPTASTTLYLFSGADFLNAYTLFPDSDRFVFAAIEDPGEVPAPAELPAGDRARSLDSLYQSMRSIAADNYFRTGVMRAQLSGNRFRGLLPVFLIFQTRLGLEIINVRRIELTRDGEVIESAAPRGYMKPEEIQNALNAGSVPPDGVEISFRKPGETRVRRLVYLRVWISDDFLAEGRPEGRYLRSLGEFNVMLKSASYFLHRPVSRELCRFLAERGRVVVQDDSGIPFQFYAPERWDLKLYGDYRGAIPLSDQLFHPSQPDLRAAYEAAQARGEKRPLPFDYGYGALYGPGRSNLLLGVRR